MCIRYRVWAVPELYFHETKSAAILIKALKEEGFEVQEGVDGIPTAFILSHIHISSLG